MNPQHKNHIKPPPSFYFTCGCGCGCTLCLYHYFSFLTSTYFRIFKLIKFNNILFKRLNLFTCVINGTFITHKTKCIWTEQYITLHIQMQCVTAVAINQQRPARSWDTYHHSHCYNNSLKVNTNVNATSFCFKVSNISLLLHFQCILKYIQYYTKTRC